jgi:hypothetical protein
MTTMHKSILLFSLFSMALLHAYSQNTMNIYQSNGTVLNIPMNTIDSITYTITAPGALPIVTTQLVESITSFSAVSGGFVSNDGASAVTHRGICWSINPTPTTANDTTFNGGGTGNFISLLSGLLPNTTYYVRAYAINSAGTSYGNELSFETCIDCGNCFDGILNNAEENIDCGGPNCAPCNHCVNGVWDVDLGEVWLDCGGECPVCPQCSNGILDGDEIGIDCGGQCGGCELLCGDGLLNGLEDQVDCETQGETPFGGCNACPTCYDGILIGDEAGIDCGGIESECDPCCSTGNCTNGIQDGMEFYIDCGGNSCPECDTLFSYRLESINYSTPIDYFIPPYYDDATGVLTFPLEDAFDTDPDAPNIPTGRLTLTLTRPTGGWPSSVGDQLLVDLTDIPNVGDPTQYSILWTDESGFQYTSALPGGRCLFVLSRYKELSITNSDLANGCNKPVGFYRFFRGSFEGTLVAIDPLAPTPEIELELGQFQFTFLP